MKIRYMKPSIAIVVKEELCSNGLSNASVHKPTGEHIDQFDVVEKEESEKSYEWDNKNAWGGD